MIQSIQAILWIPLLIHMSIVSMPITLTPFHFRQLRHLQAAVSIFFQVCILVHRNIVSIETATWRKISPCNQSLETKTGKI